MGCSGYLGHQEKYLCEFCLHEIPKFEFRFDPENQVAKTFWGRVKIENASSLLSFSNNNMVQRLMHEFKYKNNIELGLFLGKLMAIDLKKYSWFKSVDYILPVPLHPKKELIRGFNQSDILANSIESNTSKPAKTTWVKRLRHNESQTRKERYARHENTYNLFKVSKEARLKNKHVLLIDDVLTTGATLEALAISLHEIEGIRISVYTLAKAI